MQGIREYIVGPALTLTHPGKQYQLRRKKLKDVVDGVSSERETLTWSDIRTSYLLDSAISGAIAGGILNTWKRKCPITETKPDGLIGDRWENGPNARSRDRCTNVHPITVDRERIQHLSYRLYFSPNNRIYTFDERRYQTLLSRRFLTFTHAHYFSTI